MKKTLFLPICFFGLLSCMELELFKNSAEDKITVFISYSLDIQKSGYVDKDCSIDVHNSKQHFDIILRTDGFE
jgi:hypothetical protein